MLLDSAASRENLVAAYSCAINALQSKLPLTQLIARFEFLKYRIALSAKLLGNSSEGARDTHSDSCSSLNEECEELKVILRGELTAYEQKNRTAFFYRGVPYLPILREVLG